MLLSEKVRKNKKKINNFYYEIRKSKKVLNKVDAFIVFTSGTTAKPKGAILTDSSVKNNVLGIIKQLNFLPFAAFLYQKSLAHQSQNNFFVSKK